MPPPWHHTVSLQHTSPQDTVFSIRLGPALPNYTIDRIKYCQAQVQYSFKLVRSSPLANSNHIIHYGYCCFINVIPIKVQVIMNIRSCCFTMLLHDGLIINTKKKSSLTLCKVKSWPCVRRYIMNYDTLMQTYCLLWIMVPSYWHEKDHLSWFELIDTISVNLLPAAIFSLISKFA